MNVKEHSVLRQGPVGLTHINFQNLEMKQKD